MAWLKGILRFRSNDVYIPKIVLVLVSREDLLRAEYVEYDGFGFIHICLVMCVSDLHTKN